MSVPFYLSAFFLLSHSGIIKNSKRYKKVKSQFCGLILLGSQTFRSPLKIHSRVLKNEHRAHPAHRAWTVKWCSRPKNSVFRLWEEAGTKQSGKRAASVWAQTLQKHTHILGCGKMPNYFTQALQRNKVKVMEEGYNRPLAVFLAKICLSKAMFTSLCFAKVPSGTVNRVCLVFNHKVYCMWCSITHRNASTAQEEDDTVQRFTSTL